MSLKSDPDMGINSWLEDELYQQYLHDRTAVDEEWKHLFEGNGASEARRRRRPRSAPRESPRSRPSPATSSRCAARPDGSRRTCRHPWPFRSRLRSAPSPSR